MKIYCLKDKKAASTKIKKHSKFKMAESHMFEEELLEEMVSCNRLWTAKDRQQETMHFCN